MAPLSAEHADDAREALLSVLAELPISAYLVQQMALAGGITARVAARVDFIRGDNCASASDSDEQDLSDSDSSGSSSHEDDRHAAHPPTVSS